MERSKKRRHSERSFAVAEAGEGEKRGLVAGGQGGAKRSEESLTETGGGGLLNKRARLSPRRLRPLRVSDSSLRLCRKASQGSIQNDGGFSN
jgi:hypothetical protein